jgi:hypothetical protein
VGGTEGDGAAAGAAVPEPVQAAEAAGHRRCRPCGHGRTAGWLRKVCFMSDLTSNFVRGSAHLHKYLRKYLCVFMAFSRMKVCSSSSA